MYYEIYIDQFAAEHFLSEYLLLVLAARVLGRRIPAKRLAAASAAGTAVTVLGICTGQPVWYGAGLFVSGTAAFFRSRERPRGRILRRGLTERPEGWSLRRELMERPKKHILRRGLTERLKKGTLRKELRILRDGMAEALKGIGALLAVTVCFGGVLEVMTSLFGLPVLAGTAASVWLTGALLEHRKQKKARTEHVMTVQLCLGERTRSLHALLDTGNQLCEPLTGRPVSIVQKAEAEALLEEDWEQRRGCLLIPYHSLGSGKGWMRGVKLDRMIVTGADGSRSVEAPILALYEGKLSTWDDYQMILHPRHAASV